MCVRVIRLGWWWVVVHRGYTGGSGSVISSEDRGTPVSVYKQRDTQTGNVQWDSHFGDLGLARLLRLLLRLLDVVLPVIIARVLGQQADPLMGAEPIPTGPPPSYFQITPQNDTMKRTVLDPWG